MEIPTIAGVAGSVRENAMVCRLGFWSAALTAAIAAAHFVIGFMTPPRSGPFARPGDIIPYPYTDVASFIPIDYIWLYPGFLLALSFIVLMASIYSYAPAERRIFGQIGLAFAMIYAAVITMDYFIQFTVVQPSLLSGETAALSLFTQYNPHGIFIALEGLGYMMMSVSFLFVAFVFTGGKIERAIRRLFAGGFILGTVSFIVLSMSGYDVVAYEVTILTINWVVLIVTGVLLSLLFRQANRRIPRTISP